MHTLATITTVLNRHPGVIQDIQKRFGLPVFKGAAYTDSYASFLRTIIHLRILSVSFDNLTELWRLECALMRLLHADSTGSPTWFLDSCGSKGHALRRLFLSNYDIGVAVPSGAIQLGLNFSATAPELFSGSEMGVDALTILKSYLVTYARIRSSIGDETDNVRSALTIGKRVIGK
jgi:hypothetical protein